MCKNRNGQKRNFMPNNSHNISILQLYESQIGLFTRLGLLLFLASIRTRHFCTPFLNLFFLYRRCPKLYQPLRRGVQVVVYTGSLLLPAFKPLTVRSVYFIFQSIIHVVNEAVFKSFQSSSFPKLKRSVIEKIMNSADII